MAYSKGYFHPKNPHKYLGDIDDIIFRSSWELSFFRFLDDNKYILSWSSEPMAIPYMKPVMVKGKPTVKKANYYPDIYVEYVDKNGDMKYELLEIKPAKQTRPSKARKATTKMQEDYVFAVNTAKWEAAKQFCAQHDIEFKIVTEKSIFV